MIRLMPFLLGLILVASAFAEPARAPNAAEVEARTKAISKTLRCVVCQNESIADSSAPLAADMRRLVEKRVLAGDSDDEVRAYLRERYGDFVLMRPPLQSNTILLWAGPFVLFALVLVWFAAFLKKRPQATETADLSAEDRARVQAALKAERAPE